MPKKRITVTIDADVAKYLDEVPNRSLVVSEAVRDYCARRLEAQLEAAYIEDRTAAEELASEWEASDASVEE